MESPFWLPPLNSYENSRENRKTFVVVSQPQEPMINQKYPEKQFLLNFFVDITFYSNSHQTRCLKGLSLRKSFLAPCCLMIDSSQEQINKHISDLLWYIMHIPFELDHVVFEQWYANKTGWRNRILSLEDADSWVVKLQEFLHVMVDESQNAAHNLFPVNLRIIKKIRISSDVFETWLSWFDEKKRVDSTFQVKYLRAIRRPRTIQELLDAENQEFKGVKKSSLAVVLQDASLADDESTPTPECMVCLEDLSAVSQACRLPCSHVFHKTCITKWLQDSNMCPLCRFTLPSD